MILDRIALSPGARLAALLGLAAALAGCEGCELPEFSTQPPSIEDLEGTWNVSSYAADDQGCEPRSTAPDYPRIVADIEETDDARRLAIRLCPTDEDCPPEADPEHRLEWNDEQRRAQLTFHHADVVDTDPREQLCRLEMVQTLLIPDDSEAEFTQSHFEVTLPIEGQETCTAALAEEYSAQIPCVRSETAELVRPDDEGSRLTP